MGFFLFVFGLDFVFVKKIYHHSKPFGSIMHSHYMVIQLETLIFFFLNMCFLSLVLGTGLCKVICIQVCHAL